MACPSQESAGTNLSGWSGLARALELLIPPPSILNDDIRLTYAIFRICLPARRHDRERQREPKRPRAWATMHEVKLITVRTSTAPASIAVRNSLDEVQVGSNTGRSRFSARVSCERVRQGCQERGKIARTVSNQWSRMSVVSLISTPECVRLATRRHIHGSLSAALCRHSVGRLPDQLHYPLDMAAVRAMAGAAC